MKPLRIDYMSGCVTNGLIRQICGEYPDRFAVNVNGYRISGVSQMSPAVEMFPSVFEPLAGIPRKAYCMKQFEREFGKTFLDELEHNRGDVFVVDQGVDFRLNFKLMPDGNVVQTDAFEDVGNKDACRNAVKKIKSLCIDDNPLDFDVRSDIYAEFAQKIVNLYGRDRIIVLIQQCAVKYRTTDGKLRDFSDKSYTQDLKTRLEWMTGVMRRVYDGCRFVEMKDPVYSDEVLQNACYQLHPETKTLDETKAALTLALNLVPAIEH